MRFYWFIVIIIITTTILSPLFPCSARVGLFLPNECFYSYKCCNSIGVLEQSVFTGRMPFWCQTKHMKFLNWHFSTSSSATSSKLNHRCDITPVNLSIVVEVVETLKNFLENCGDSRLIQHTTTAVGCSHTMFDYIKQWPLKLCIKTFFSTRD